MSDKEKYDFDHSFRRALNAVKAGVQEGTHERHSPFTSPEGKTLIATIPTPTMISLMDINARTAKRATALLEPQLIGLKGRRVEVIER